MSYDKTAFEAARKVLVGGVNSPARAFGAVGGEPVFIREGHGSRLTGGDGKEYVDFIAAWGPMILGHADPDVVQAVREAAARSFSFGLPTEQETALAEEVINRIPSIERLRFVNSGTEATMSAIRLARGYTGRDKIIKFAGCYHGHADYLLVKAGSGATTHGFPDSAGVPQAMAKDTLIARFNDLSDVDRCISEAGGDLAAIILEPVAGNMGVMPPVDGFLGGLRERCDSAGAVLIFDEVMSGFRVARGGAQELFDVTPDLTCLGKILGGGLPVGAYGGRTKIMEKLSPLGPVYQAGTNSGNPVAMAAGLATLKKLDVTVYERLEECSARVQKLFEGVLGDKVIVQRVGSMMTVFHLKDGAEKNDPLRNYDDLSRVDAAKFGKFFTVARQAGILFPPSAYEAFFISLAHGDDEFEKLKSFLQSYA